MGSVHPRGVSFFSAHKKGVEGDLVISACFLLHVIIGSFVYHNFR